MAINFGFTNPNGGPDYLETLRALGQQEALQQQTQIRGYDFNRQQQMDQARPEIQRMAASGDIQGAQQQAFAIGDYDALKTVSGMSAQHHEQLAQQMGTLGRLATSLIKLPAEQRAKAYQAVVPMLAQQGYDKAQLAGADLSDAGLQQYIAAAASTSDVLKSYYANQEDYTLAPGSRRYNGQQLVAENPAAPKYVTTPAGAVSTLVSGGGGDPASTAGDLFSRMIGAESGGRQFGANGRPLTSPAGAVGIAQVMPNTGPEAARLAGIEWDPQRYRSDPTYNAQIGRAYFEQQLQQFGDPAKAAAAYNAGPGRVQQAVLRYGDAWLDHLPDETKQYVSKTVGGPPAQIVGQPRSAGGRGGGESKPPSGFRWKGDGTLEPIPGGPADKGKTGTTALKPVPTKSLTDYQDNITSLRQIDEVMALLDPRNNSPAAQRARKAIGPGTGMLGDTFTQLNDPEGTEARAMIGRIGGIIIKDTSGAAVSASEDNRLAKWIPLPTDTPQAARAKLGNLRNAIGNTQQSFNDVFNEDNGFKPLRARNDPSRNAPQQQRPQQQRSGAIGIGQSTQVGAFKVTRVK